MDRYVDLKSAFDSVDREALWLLLRRHGIPDKLVELMKELYTGTSDPAVGSGGSRKRRLGGRVYLPWLADLTRRRK